MRRLLEPRYLLFFAALLGSLAVHLPTYVSLGWLAERLLERSEAETRSAPSETAPQDSDASDPTAKRPDERSFVELVPIQDLPDLPDVPETPREIPPIEPPAEPEKIEEKVVAEEQATPARPRPPIPESPEHAIIQKSRDPDVEPPPDTPYVAEENQRVEEETVAAITNTVRDDEIPELPSRPEPAEDDPSLEGSDEEDELAGVRDREGEERRPPVEPTRPEPPQDAPAESPREERRAGRSREADSDEQEIVIDDGFGSFAIRGRRGPREAAGEGGLSSERRRAPNLKLGYAQFEGIIGADVLADDRLTEAEERRARRRGSRASEDFQEFRASLENFVSNVKTGNQTALNARRSPFAAYIQRVHLRFHELFHANMANLPRDGAHSDETLITRLEIVLEEDGRLVEVGVVRSSGQILFDLAAYSAVKRGAPYPAAPGEILSDDGRVYLQWDFRRDMMACHQLQARPFILEGLSNRRSEPRRRFNSALSP